MSVYTKAGEQKTENRKILISREEAVDLIMDEPSEARYPFDYAEKIRQLSCYARHLPNNGCETVSEQPDRKTGKWIPHISKFGGPDERVYTCDQCGHRIGFCPENYCPDCGVSMGGWGIPDLVDIQAVFDLIMGEPTEVRYPIYYAERIRKLLPEQPEDVQHKDYKRILSGQERKKGGTT